MIAMDYLPEYTPIEIASCRERCYLLAQICENNALPHDLVRVLYQQCIVVLEAPTPVFTSIELREMFKHPLKKLSSRIKIRQLEQGTLFTTTRKEGDCYTFTSVVVYSNFCVVPCISCVSLRDPCSQGQLARHRKKCITILDRLGLAVNGDCHNSQAHDYDTYSRIRLMDRFLNQILLEKPLIVLDEAKEYVSFYQQLKDCKRVKRHPRYRCPGYTNEKGFVYELAYMLHDYESMDEQDTLVDLRPYASFKAAMRNMLT